jgi:hypothetical protein
LHTLRGRDRQHEPNGYADERDFEPASYDHPQQLRCRCAKRDANADLLSPPLHRERHGGVDTQAGEQQRETGECAHQ